MDGGTAATEGDNSATVGAWSTNGAQQRQSPECAQQSPEVSSDEPGANTLAPQPPAAPRPDPEVVDEAKRRAFTAEYKQRVLAEADAAATQPGAIGALLRREGLYSSHLVTWRRERQAGMLKGLTPHKRPQIQTHPTGRGTAETSPGEPTPDRGTA